MIEYKNAKNEKQPQYIKNILDYIVKDKEFFFVLSRLLIQYNCPDSNAKVKAKRHQDLLDLILLSDSLIQYPDEEIEKFMAIVEDLYEEKADELHKSRGKILEWIVYTFSPLNFQGTSYTKKYVEPQLYHNGVLVGYTNHVMDVVVHDHGPKTQADLFECKADVTTFLDLKRKIHNMRSRNKRRKCIYMREVNKYLNRQQFMHKMYIGCWNNDVTSYQNHLNTCGFGFVEILNDDKIAVMIEVATACAS